MLLAEREVNWERFNNMEKLSIQEFGMKCNKIKTEVTKSSINASRYNLNIKIWNDCIWVVDELNNFI